MDTEIGYVEKCLKKISADKNRMIFLIFNILSVLCTILYLTCTGSSGIHFVFVLALLLAACANVLLAVDVDHKVKRIEDVVLIGVGVVFIGIVLKVIKIGLSFSVIYLIGYFVYAITYLLLGIYCSKNSGSPKIIKLLLIVCAIWSIFEFFNLQNSFLRGIIWRLFRISEAFLSIGYLFFLNSIEKSEKPFAELVGEYKKQIPSLKLCIIILLVISIVSAGIGSIVYLEKRPVSTVTNETEVVPETKTTKKSTVTSTVTPAETEVKEYEEINIGDKVETDSFTFKLNKVELSRRVQPDNPPSYYTYYQAETDHIYIYVNASITNKDKYPLECDEIYSVTADFDGGYKYNGFNIADDSDGDFTYANITSVEPLATLGVHSLIDCPQVVEEEGKELFITITLNNGNKYKYKIKGE